MNVTELARRLRVTPQQLLAKLPELGFDIGARAIKVDDRTADQIYKKWLENSRRERLREHGLQRLRERLANDGDHHDGRVERCLEVVAHRGNGGSRPVL